MENKRERDDITVSKVKKKGDRNNGRKPQYNNRDRRRNEKFDSVFDRDRGVKFNDPAWYKLNDQIAHDVASFSFGTPTGSNFAMNSWSDQGSFTTAVPGTYSIYTIPSLGRAVYESSPINLAMNSLFRDLRKGNTGSQVYDQPDLIMYIMAMDSLFSWYATLVRLYGLGRTYSYVNRYYASGITLAQGFDPSVLNNLAWLRGYINQLSVKINQFAVPNSLNIFKRHYWMFSNIFRDGPGAKSQTYMYVPQALYTYVETEGAGYCTLIDVCGTVQEQQGCLPRTALTEQAIINITNSLIDPLIKSQDIGIMSGDIVKFWGDQLYQITGIPDDYSIDPVYSAEVLSQIHNTTYTGNQMCDETGAYCTYLTANITQAVGINEGYIVCNPKFRGNLAQAYDKIVDMTSESPSVDEVLVATRNTIVLNTLQYISNQSAYLYELFASGSELCLYHVTGAWQPSAGAFLFTVEPEAKATADATATTAKLYRRLSVFDQAPLIYQTGTSAPHTLSGVFGDIQNYRVFTRQDLEVLHNGVILAMFALKDTLK